MSDFRDGFYLSAYLTPSGLHRLANIWMRHDNNVSLWRKTGPTVELVAHWELERVTGQKQHRAPFATVDRMRAFVADLLSPYGLGLADLVEIWGTPELATGGDQPASAFAVHALAHLHSAVLLDSETFFDGTIVGLAVDREPDRVLDEPDDKPWFVGCVVEHGSLDLVPIASPGPLWGAAGERFRRREGTLMALATATSAAGRCDRDRILEEHDFAGARSFAEAQVALGLLVDQVRETLVPDPAFDAADNLASAVMKEIQALSVTLMERNVDRIIAHHPVDTHDAHLAVAGGFALNCPTTSHLMTRYGFRALLAPPCVSDTGQSVGIALGAFHRRYGGERFDFRYPGPYLGRADEDLDGALREFRAHVLDVTPLGLETAVDDLLDAPVAWFAGRSEVGPRALGHRSLLADPRAFASKALLNQVKQREPWRPVAPMVLEERMAEWFEDARPSPYMLETFTIRPERRALIPAVAHLDFSARVQSVGRADEPVLHDLLTAFARRTGVPVLCNTSLNDRGEPIVDLLREALCFCVRKRLPVAYLNGTRVALGNFDTAVPVPPRARRFEGFSPSPEEVAETHRLMNPYLLDPVQLRVYLVSPQLRARHDIRTAAGAGAVRAAIERRFEQFPGARERAEQWWRADGESLALGPAGWPAEADVGSG